MSYSDHICGCYVLRAATDVGHELTRHYLPQLELAAYTTVHAAAFSTNLIQKYTNPGSETLKELRYTFPLYDGVSVVGFEFRIQGRVIAGIVREKDQAKAIYDDSVKRGETAGLLEQSLNAADVFSTTLDNMPPLTDVDVRIEYVGELKHDAEIDGIRFTIPTAIAPRYGSYPGEMLDSNISKSGMRITVDASLPMDSKIQKLLSPSHPIEVSIGVLSSAPDADMSANMASATLALASAELDNDFVIQLVAKDSGIPRAMLEFHSKVDGQRALMTTLVPKFSLKPSKPELIFIADRSGSMSGNPMTTLKSALQVFLKSLPVGVKFNICSFGTTNELLWPESATYSQSSLKEATDYVNRFSADFGGTETFAALKATIDSRRTDMPTEIMLLTDGDIWQQQPLFDYLNQKVAASKGQLRVFTIGIGGGVSSALIEGIARAGNGFSQLVGNGERLEAKLVRMLKGALAPHFWDCELQVKYRDDAEDFETIERVSDSLTIEDVKSENTAQDEPRNDTPISLYDPEAVNEDIGTTKADADRFAHLPDFPAPKLLQVPSELPPLFPFSRTYAYLLVSPEKKHLRPESVILEAKSSEGPLEIEIPIDQKVQSGALFHQLAAKKAIQELEEGRGWINDVKCSDGKLLSKTHPSWQDQLREREAIRLGVEYQVAGKHCCFVAVERTGHEHVEGDIEDSTRSMDHAHGFNEWDCTIGSKENQPSAPRRRRMGGPPRASTSGQPIRKQMASRAAPPSPAGPTPTTSNHTDISTPAYQGYGGRKRSLEDLDHTQAKGRALRHRRIAVSNDDGTESEEQREDAEILLLARIVSAQSFAGFWPSEAVPWGYMGVKVESVVEAAGRLEGFEWMGGVDEKTRVLASMCVLVFLEGRMAHQRDEWELVGDKGIEWVRGVVGGGDAGVDERTGVVRGVAGKVLDGTMI